MSMKPSDVPRHTTNGDAVETADRRDLPGAPVGDRFVAHIERCGREVGSVFALGRLVFDFAERCAERNIAAFALLAAGLSQTIRALSTTTAAAAADQMMPNAFAHSLATASAELVALSDLMLRTTSRVAEIA